MRPPHFVLVVHGLQKPVVTGQNNLFHAIVLFLHYVNLQHQGFLLYACTHTHPLRTKQETRSR